MKKRRFSYEVYGSTGRQLVRSGVLTVERDCSPEAAEERAREYLEEDYHPSFYLLCLWPLGDAELGSTHPAR